MQDAICRGKLRSMNAVGNISSNEEGKIQIKSRRVVTLQCAARVW